ncbi:MAG: glutamine-hydrolyzing GMP synthase [Spirochaetes bacterium]|nr:glutamine-hydrolyzing GMP synthase [Spirochaetota bacterium]
MIGILDFGSQYTMLICRRIRELGFYSEIYPFNKWEELISKNPAAIILSGSPYSVYNKDSPKLNREFFKKTENINILAICYGMQLVTYNFGGEVTKAQIKEYGKAKIFISNKEKLFKDLPSSFNVWMSHGDSVVKPPVNSEVLAYTDSTPYAAFKYKNIYCVQFHPEVYHTEYGQQILLNFLKEISSVKVDWNEELFVKREIQKIREEVGNEKVILALSGGVDSTVVAFLLREAIGEKLILVYIDTGLMRKNETNEIVEFFSKIFGNSFKTIYAEKLFLKSLKGVIDPEKKRKLIGKLFIELFTKEAKKIGGIKYLAQGTLYPDVIESISYKGPSSTIKTHHNVGGLPKNMNFKLVEPLRELFKDEVRKVGKYLGIPDKFLTRKPFPGPGLAIRIIGEVTKERLEILREADFILRDIISKYEDIDKSIWQLFAVLLPIKSVGVMGDERTYEYVCAIRAVSSVDGMTADWFKIPHDVLDNISSSIVNKVAGINRVVYDITSKPPATIEWE